MKVKQTSSRWGNLAGVGCCCHPGRPAHPGRAPWGGRGVASRSRTPAESQRRRWREQRSGRLAGNAGSCADVRPWKGTGSESEGPTGSQLCAFVVSRPVAWGSALSQVRWGHSSPVSVRHEDIVPICRLGLR